MAYARPHCGGLAGSCKSARLGLGFPASEPDAEGTPRPYLPPDIVRLIDAMLRAKEREAWLYAMKGGNLGETLIAAADEGGLLDTRFLLATGADFGAEYGRALKLACRGGHIQIAEALLDAGGGTLTPNHRNEAMCRAAMFGHTACCEWMLDRGADIHHDADLALYWAGEHGHLETVTVLLDRGADAWSEEALEGAMRYKRDAVVALLLARRGGGAAQ